jgi:hypothetical protein
VTRCAAQRRRLIDSGSTIPSGTIDDLGVSQRRFAHQGYRLCARSARQGHVTLGARRGNEIDKPVPVICGPCPYNDRCLIAERPAAVSGRAGGRCRVCRAAPGARNRRTIRMGLISRRADCEVHLTRRWREPDSNHRSRGGVPGVYVASGLVRSAVSPLAGITRKPVLKSCVARDRWFESRSLQRRVACEPDPAHHQSNTPAATPGTVP